jgi:hypothetical protein
MAVFGRFLYHPAILAIAALVPAAPVLAGEGQSPPAPPSEDGRVIYARDVHHSIGQPHFPGATHAAVTAPTGTIVGSLAIGLAPLTDSETASVTASVPAALQVGGVAELRPFAAEPGASQATTMLGAEGGARSIGASIGNAMGALTGALGTLSALTGGRP